MRSVLEVLFDSYSFSSAAAVAYPTKHGRHHRGFSRVPPPLPPFVHHHLVRLPPPCSQAARGTSPCDWFPFSAGWRAVGLPTCRPLPRSHYDADSRGRCTNLSATPLTCVSCLPSQRVRWSGSSLSLSFSLSFFSSLLFTSSLFFIYSFTLSLPPRVSPLLTPYQASSFSLCLRLSPSTSPHAAVRCCSVVSSCATSTILPNVWRQRSIDRVSSLWLSVATGSSPSS